MTDQTLQYSTIAPDDQTTPPDTGAIPNSSSPAEPAPVTADTTQQPAPDQPTSEPPSVAGLALNALSDAGQFATTPGEWGKAIVQGTADFLNEGTKSVDHLATAGTEFIKKMGIPDVVVSWDKEGLHARLDRDPTTDASAGQGVTNFQPKGPETGTGKLAASAVQFAEGLATVSRLLPSGSGAGFLTRVGADATKFGATAAAFFDPYKERLSNIIQSHPSIANPVAAFLAADPNDSEAMARFKNGLENAGMGIAVDSFIHGVGAIRSFMRGDHGAAVDAATNAGQAAQDAQAAPAPAEQVAGDAPQAPSADPTPNPTDGHYVPVAPVENVMVTRPEGHVDGQPMRPDNTPEPIQFTPEQIRQTADGLMGAVRADAEDPFNRLDPSLSLVNLNYITNSDARQALMTELGQRVGSILQDRGMLEQQSQAQWMDQARNYARNVGADPEQWILNVTRAAGDVNSARIIDLANRVMMNGVESDLRRLAQWHAEGHTGPLSQEQFDASANALAQAHMEMAAGHQQLGQAAGRLLASRQATAGQSSVIASAITNSSEATAAGGDAAAARSLMFQRIAAAPQVGPEAQNALSRFIHDAYHGGSQRLASYYINSLLGYKTIVVKGTSDFIKGGIIQPSEQAFRGLYRGLTSNDWTQFTQAGGQVAGMMRSITNTLEFGGRNAYSFTRQAYRSGEGVLDPGSSTVGSMADTAPTSTVDILQAIRDGDYTHAMVSGIGKALQYPTQLINGLHEFSQQVIYRGRVYGKAGTDATLEGLTDQAREQFIQQRLIDAFGANGEATDQEALAYARAGTYSTPLTRGSISGALQNLASQHPLARVVVPFIKAPVNLLGDAFRYTPGIQTAIDAARVIQGGGGDAAQDLVGRLAVGSSLWAVGLTLAYNGHITDGGSYDSNAAEEQKETGWMPHSLVLHDADGTPHYYDLSRIDPFGQILSMAADMHSIAANSSDDDISKVGVASVMALSRDVLSKNYLKNFSDLMAAINDHGSDADEKWQRLLQGMAGGLVPSQLAGSDDNPVMREARSMLDAMKAKIPGFSQTVDRRYNTLGEPIVRADTVGPKFASPFYQSINHDDLVQATLSQIANTNPTGFRPPPRTARLPGSKGSGVDLTQFPSSNGHSAYDRYQQLIGDLGNGTPTLREQLGAAIQQNPDFWTNPNPDGTKDIQGLRYSQIAALLAQRRTVAFAMLVRENPQLKQALDNDIRRGALVQRYGGSTVNPDALQGVKQK